MTHRPKKIADNWVIGLSSLNSYQTLIKIILTCWFSFMIWFFLTQFNNFGEIANNWLGGFKLFKFSWFEFFLQNVQWLSMCQWPSLNILVCVSFLSGSCITSSSDSFFLKVNNRVHCRIVTWNLVEIQPWSEGIDLKKCQVYRTQWRQLPPRNGATAPGLPLPQRPIISNRWEL